MSDDEVIWYCLQNEKSLGPFSKNQLIQLAFSSAIPKDTLIWTSSQNQQWRPLEGVFNLKEELPPPLPSTQSQSLQPIGATPVGTANLEADLPHPWRRYFARLLDNIVNGSVIWIAIGLMLAAVAPSKAKRFFNFIGDRKNEFANIFLTCLIAPFANAAFIGFTGSSLGKWFFGVKVIDHSGRAIGYTLALKREFLVWLYGIGLGIPLVSFCTALHQKSQLEKDKTTSWDRDLNLQVVYRKSGVLQYFLSLVGFALSIFIYMALTKL